MKNIKRLYKFLFFAVTTAALVSCSVDDGPIKKKYLDVIDAVPAISTKVDPSGNQSIDVLNPGSFQGKFTVSEFFDGPGSFSPDKVDVVVRKNGGTGTKVKVYKADVTSFPASFTVSGTEIQALFGEPIVVNDNYDFSADIYVGGKKYEAFPLGGVSTSSGPTAAPGFSHFARYGAICAYNSAIYQGDFEVVSDAWDEVAPGTIVKLTRISETTFSFEYPEVANPKAIVVTVNPITNRIEFARQSVGGNWNWGGPYTGSFLSGGGTNSMVYPCDESFTIELAYGVDQGSWGGTYPFVLKKVQ